MRRFSLVELMAAVAVLGVVAALAMGAWSSRVESARVWAAGQSLARELQLMKRLAVERQRAVGLMVVASAPGEADGYGYWVPVSIANPNPSLETGVRCWDFADLGAPTGACDGTWADEASVGFVGGGDGRWWSTSTRAFSPDAVHWFWGSRWEGLSVAQRISLGAGNGTRGENVHGVTVLGWGGQANTAAFAFEPDPATDLTPTQAELDVPGSALRGRCTDATTVVDDPQGGTVTTDVTCGEDGSAHMEVAGSTNQFLRFTRDGSRLGFFVYSPRGRMLHSSEDYDCSGRVHLWLGSSKRSPGDTTYVDVAVDRSGRVSWGGATEGSPYQEDSAARVAVGDASANGCPGAED